MRWVVLVGRTGSVLIMIGLALVLAPLFPSATTQSGSSSFTLSPGGYDTSFPLTLSSKIKLHLSVEAKNSVYIYLLNTTKNYLQSWALSWIKQQFPNVEEPELGYLLYNSTVLNNFLQSNPSVTLWKSDLSSRISEEFSFSTFMDVIIVFENPSPNYVEVNYEYRKMFSLASKEIVLSYQLLASIGLILAVP